MTRTDAPRGEMTRRIAEIEAAFLRVKSSAEKAIGGDQASKDRSFREIFELNNEIGKVARQIPSTMVRMKELQESVNMITVGLKYGRDTAVNEGLSFTSKSIRALKKDFSQPP